MTIAVQTAVGAIGEKATTELSCAFAGMVNCGAYQYGVNSTGIYRLNSGNLDGTTPLAFSFTLASSDFGKRNYKRPRFVYLEVEIYEDTAFTVSVKPNRGTFIDKTVTAKGPGVKTIKVPIQREGMQGNFHTIKISGTKQFRVHEVSGLFIVRPSGAGGTL